MPKDIVDKLQELLDFGATILEEGQWYGREVVDLSTATAILKRNSVPVRVRLVGTNEALDSGWRTKVYRVTLTL